MRHLLGLLIGLTLTLATVTDRAGADAPILRLGCEAALAIDAGAVTPTAITTFRNLRHARGRIGAVRRHVARYLHPEDLARLDALLDQDDSSVVALEHATELYDLALRNFARDFALHADDAGRVLESQFAKVTTLNYRDVLTNLMTLQDRFDHCRRTLAFERCAPIWQRIQDEFGFKRDPAPAEPVVDTTPRPIDEVAKLTVLGSDARRTEFRAALRNTFPSRAAIQREARRDADELAGQGRRHEYTWLPSLDGALRFLSGPPRIIELASKVVLQAPARVGGKMLDVDVVFDPRNRYVTVQRPGGEGDARYYYKLGLDSNGTLRIHDEPPLLKSQVYKFLRDTHFAY